MATYFRQLPSIHYEFADGVLKHMNDLTVRVNIIQQILNDNTNYNRYNVVEGEYPEDVAYRFYNDPQLHWVVMMANNIFSIPQDWPLTSPQLDEFMIRKYRQEILDMGYSAVATAQVRQYIETNAEASIDVTNNAGNIQSITVQPFGYRIPNSYYVSQNTVIDGVTAVGVNRFTYETELNDEKRRIIVPKTSVVEDITAELRRLANG